MDIFDYVVYVHQRETAQELFEDLPELMMRMTDDLKLADAVLNSGGEESDVPILPPSTSYQPYLMCTYLDTSLSVSILFTCRLLAPAGGASDITEDRDKVLIPTSVVCCRHASFIICGWTEGAKQGKATLKRHEQRRTSLIG